MLAREQFDGSNTPFEGDRTLLVRSLPEGAQVTHAVVTLQPVKPPNRPLFEEQIIFSNNPADSWGATKSSQLGGALATDPPGFAEVDFHARRTLHSATGTSLDKSTLQVDLGGLYVSITKLGTIQTPTDPSEYELPGDGLLPSLATNKFKLSLHAAKPDIEKVIIHSTPSNITLRLGQQPSFFARPGELAQKESCPDFSQILQTFLAEAEVKDGFYEIPLTVHSDTIARLNITMDVEYVQEQSPLPGGLQQATLTFDHSSVAQPGSATLQVNVPAGARVIPGRTTARVRGSFQNSRIVYGPTGDLQPATWIPVNPSRAQATPLLFVNDVAVSSVDVLLAAKNRTAQFALDIVKDVDGRPWTESVLPEPAKLAIDSEIAGRPTWVNVPLSVEVQFKAGLRYWLVLQSLQGEAAWYVSSQSSIARAASNGIWTAGGGVSVDRSNTGPIGVYYTDNGGLSWRQEVKAEATGPLEAFVHLRQPAPVFQMPIALQVGQGETARRVSLDRFQPSGRVDFSLDFDEVAEAINQVAGTSGTPAVPQGEHLRNGDMEKWKRIGDRLGFIQHMPVENIPGALAISPDGEKLYVLSKVPGASAFLEVYETACGEQAASSVDLGVGEPIALFINPDGTRASVTLGNSLIWVDLEAMQTVGLEYESTSPSIAAFSPDGSQLYLLHYESDAGSISTLGFASVEKAFRAQSDPLEAILSTIDIGSRLQPVDIVVSPDGTRLYVAVLHHANQTNPGGGVAVTNPPGELYAFDTFSGGQVFGPVSVQTSNTEININDIHLSLALSPDGQRIAVTNSSDKNLFVIDTRRGRLEGVVTFEQGAETRLQAVVISPDGRRAFVAHRAGRIVSVVDLPNRVVIAQIPVRNSPVDLAITPGGEKVFGGLDPSPITSPAPPTTGLAEGALSTGTPAQEQEVSIIPIGALLPEEWTLTSGNIFPFCVPKPSILRRVALLGAFEVPSEKVFFLTHDSLSGNINSTGSSESARSVSVAPRPQPPRVTAISQVVPVVGGIRYGLEFSGLATTPEATAEVFWYGAECSFQQVDRLPFEIFDGDLRTFRSDLSGSALEGKWAGASTLLLPSSRLEMTSPSGAVLAEVRFSVPANEAALLDNVSLLATADSLSNGDLQGQTGGRLSAWELVPAGAVGVTVVASAGSVTIRNGGSAVCSLQQIASFPAEKTFHLSYAGQGLAGNPMVRLEWLGVNNERLGMPLEIPLIVNSSNHEERLGISPAGTQSASLSLVLPPGVSLSVSRISLEKVEEVSVPISFVAQAPGELTVSDVRVVYEMAPQPPPGIPAQGLCPPTPPGGSPGKGSQGRYHCPNCGEDDELCDPGPAMTPAGAPALEGECCHCGAHISLPGEAPSTKRIMERSIRADVNPSPIVLRRFEEVMRPITRRAMFAGPITVPTPPAPASLHITTELPTLTPPPPSAAQEPVRARTRATKLIGVAELTEEQANRLATAGINTLAKLSRVKPETVSSTLGISHEAARAILTEAKRLYLSTAKKKKK